MHRKDIRKVFRHTSITGYNGPTCPSSSNGKYDDANAAAHAEPPHECRANH
ncbi:hypothetical protein SNOG_03806 [Parastagonospora nodorum SN15]|uniref:Uncharacterized protein n=1 Tax=Phaeosphaeria nodorum (strain SN15 / ATCC MYA-4574 / FGSC 10173) TaxID=321614 RepID=Q0UWQ8_PHANO|nr:hypothetical protein SNOG_03806 [Parastagonospora nodorum SN15]EAT89011.1 hypothetical protein SNOG_03806 [Parastagonospora nodorum SN15]